MEGSRLEIKALGEWSARLDGKPVATGPNLMVVLHALVLGRGRVYRDDLIDLLPNVTQSRDQQLAALRNALSSLRRLSLDISSADNPVVMKPSQPHASIDLWDFFTHVEFGRYDKAHALISAGQEPYLLANEEDPRNRVWERTLSDFRQARRATIDALDASSGRRRSMLDVRERLLARSLVPGVGRRVAIAEVRERLEPLAVPWRDERPTGAGAAGSLSEHVAELLTADGPPRQVVLVGGVGAGKTLAAISAFLRLTDGLADTGGETRTVLFVDGEAEPADDDFASDRWLERRLRRVGGEGQGRPVTIVTNADALLNVKQQRLRQLLDSRLLRDTDVLLCAGSQLYARRLAYEDYGTHVIHLEPWGRPQQLAFADAVFGPERRALLERWLDSDPTRGQLCAVPLHLVYVLSLLDEGEAALAEVTNQRELFEGVARMRLHVAGAPFDQDELMQDLASLAHRFYPDASPADGTLHFTTEEIKQHLRRRGRKAVKRRAATLVDDTLLQLSADHARLHFEAPSWQTFFVARHLTSTLLYGQDEVLEAFSRFLSADVLEACRQMLEPQLARHRAAIAASLRFALLEQGPVDLTSGRWIVAREQIGYLAGRLDDRAANDVLTPLLDAGSPLREPSNLVRRGIAIGLAEGGRADVADAYVDELRGERASGGPSPRRDTNLGFLLSVRGDQRFDPERPAVIHGDALPLHSVTDLVDALTDGDLAAAWRVKLFTLVDLAAHPAVPDANLERALAPHRERLAEIADRLALDPVRERWPELAELRLLLDRATPATSDPAIYSSRA